MRILFVCLGNICRSPTAEAVFRNKLQRAGLAAHIIVDSAGTAGWHIGKAPDSRTQEAASRRGYDMFELQARQVDAQDFFHFELILAMDKANLLALQELQPVAATASVDLLLRYCQMAQDEVPDPYYGGEEGFDQVLELIETASDRLLQILKDQL